MSAIEVITAKAKLIEKKDPNTGEVIQLEVYRWNATVANLTLMALGSSAPEILLSIIEAWRLEFYAGPLGPSCIVGSAAFNLLCICGACARG